MLLVLIRVCVSCGLKLAARGVDEGGGVLIKRRL